MKQSEKVRAPVLAAGGIVVRRRSKPLIAVVRLRKNKAWVLPKGKLKPGEDALAAARREVEEETGHEVSVHEFLGAMSHAEGDRLKVVHFWRMQATRRPARKLMCDVTKVKWLPLQEAVDTLTRAPEKVFLAQVGPAALKAIGQTHATQAERPAPAPDYDGEPVPSPTDLPEEAAPETVADAPEAPLPAIDTVPHAAARSTMAANLWAWLRRIGHPVSRHLS